MKLEASYKSLTQTTWSADFNLDHLSEQTLVAKFIPSVRSMGKHQSKLTAENLAYLRQCTAFSDRELDKWYKGFMKDCPSGKMTKKEFEQIYKNFFKEGDATKFATHVFRTFDKDGNGSIDFREFICGLSITCHGTKEDKLRWAFNMYDIDGSGTITEDELVEIIKSIYKMMSGTEEGRKEAEDQEPPEELAAQLFQRMDEDGDGEVTIEFVEAAKDDPTILKLLQQ